MDKHSDITLPGGATTTLHVAGTEATSAPFVLVMPAMGVPAGYYGPFVDELARHGVAAGVADYTGQGDATPHVGRGRDLGYDDLAHGWLPAVVDAVRRQNVQAAAGIVGGAPYSAGVKIQMPVNAQGRLTDHRINLTLYALDRVMAGDLAEIIDALTAHDQAARLAEESGRHVIHMEVGQPSTPAPAGARRCPLRAAGRSRTGRPRWWRCRATEW